MKLYEFMAGKNWPRSYGGKILLVSFVGVHIPMIGAVTYVLAADPTPLSEQLDVLGAMLIATLIGTAATMLVNHLLLSPIRAAANATEAYFVRRETPRLPVVYDDEVGLLMSRIQECITRLDNSLATTEFQYHQLEQDFHDKFKMLSGMQHDFRTPLTHILGFSALMKADSLGALGREQQEQFADKINASGQELLQTLNALLEMSDAQCAEQIAMESEKCDLVRLATEVMDLEHLQTEQAGVSVTLETPSRLEIDTVSSAAKALMATMLQASACASPRGGTIELELLDGVDEIYIRATSHGGKLALEDVPAHLAHHFETLSSETGATSTVAETATPITLRLSLIDTLCRAIGANLDLCLAEGQGFWVQVSIPKAALDAIDERATLAA